MSNDQSKSEDLFYFPDTTLLDSKVLEYIDRVNRKIELSSHDSYPIESYESYIKYLQTAVDKIKEYFLTIPDLSDLPTLEYKLNRRKDILDALTQLYMLISPLTFLDDGEFPAIPLSNFHHHFGSVIKLGKKLEFDIKPYYVPMPDLELAYTYRNLNDLIVGLAACTTKEPKDFRNKDLLVYYYKIGIPPINNLCIPSLVTVYHEYAHIIWERVIKCLEDIKENRLESDDLWDEILEIIKKMGSELDALAVELSDRFLERTSGISIEQPILGIINKWTTELICDLFAYKIIGPSIYFALCCDCMHKEIDTWVVRLKDINRIDTAHPSTLFRLHQLLNQFYDDEKWKSGFNEISNFDTQWSDVVKNLPTFLTPERNELEGNVVIINGSFDYNDQLLSLLNEKLPDIGKNLNNFINSISTEVENCIINWRSACFSEIDYRQISKLLEDLINFIQSQADTPGLKDGHNSDLPTIMLAICLGYFCIMKLGPKWPEPDVATDIMTLDQKLLRFKIWAENILNARVVV